MQNPLKRVLSFEYQASVSTDACINLI